MNKTVGAILGAAAGLFLFGSAGYALGYLYLAWYGPADCCGLEGLYPLVVGSLVGCLLGLFCGGLAGMIAARRHPLKLMRLVLLVVAGGATAWLVSLVVGRSSAESTGSIVTFLAVTLVIPTLVWITDAWEKPDTSI
jgi:hypothetical protein